MRVFMIGDYEFLWASGTSGKHHCIAYNMYVPYLLDYMLLQIDALPPLRGLSYCAGVLSHEHAPPAHVYMRVLTRSCVRYTCMRLYLYVAQSFYSSIMSNNIIIYS